MAVDYQAEAEQEEQAHALTGQSTAAPAGLMECVNEQLKNVSQIEHTRHRSPTNGIINMMAAVVAYTFQPKKPRLDLSTPEREPRHSSGS